MIVLCIVFVFNSCQSGRNNTNEKPDKNDSIKIDNASEQEVEYFEVDTITIQDRFLEGDIFKSHIKLDFARITKNVSDSKEVLVIDKICAVSVIPDTSWINQTQIEMGDGWNEIVSNNQYYELLAKDTLKSVGIPTLFASRENRCITFTKADKSNFIVDLTEMKDAWGLILFNRMDNPVLWSSTDIDLELKGIFNK